MITVVGTKKRHALDDNRVTIRPASPGEAGDLFKLISDNLETGHLLPRPLGEVVLHIPRFVVAADNKGVVGCAELARLGPNLAEVRSLVVVSHHRGHGVGTQLITQMVEMAGQNQYPKLCAFTHAPKPFIKLGFSIVPHPWLPDKISSDCHSCKWFRRCAQYAVVLDLKAVKQ